MRHWESNVNKALLSALQTSGLWTSFEETKKIFMKVCQRVYSGK